MVTSVHGRALQFDNQNLYLYGVPVGNPITGRGKYLYVDSNVAGSDGSSPSTALATLDEAFAKCTANVGDTIVVMPKHAETITGAGGIAHDVAGVRVVGLGTGNQRPRFLMDGATTVTYAITAADAVVENLVFASGHSNVVACITTTKAHTKLINLSFVNNTTDEDFLTPIKATSTTTGDCDGLNVVGCRWITIDADDLEFIEINGTCDGVRVLDNFVVTAGTASPLILVATGKLLTGAEIGRNRLQNKMTANELFFSSDGSTNTGVAYDNYCGHRDVTTTHDLGLEASGIDIFNLWSTSTAALQGGVIPAADVNS